MRLPTIALLVLAAGACATANQDGLPDWFDLQFQITSFYATRAQERGATCNLPEMSITRAEVVEETPERLVLDVTYFWRDNAYGDRSDVQFGRINPCQGFARRQ